MSDRGDWLKWRHAGIGSSDAAAIMGVSPWKTITELYEEKILPEPPAEKSSYITDLGNEMEPRIRSLYELRAGQSFPPALRTMADYPFLRCSLDGLSESGAEAIEIKLLGREDWELAKKGIVAEKYVPQLSHQFLVSGVKKITYLGYLFEKGMTKFSASLDKLVIVEVLPSPEYILVLLKAELEFWDCVLHKKPPILGSDEYMYLTGVEDDLQFWKQLKEAHEELEKEIESVRQKIIAKAESTNHSKFLVDGIRIRKESRVGSVNYKTIPELQGVDLDKYRGKGSSSWKFEILREDKV